MASHLTDTEFIPLESSFWLLCVLFGMAWTVLKMVWLIIINLGFRIKLIAKEGTPALHSTKITLSGFLIFCYLFLLISVLQKCYHSIQKSVSLSDRMYTAQASKFYGSWWTEVFCFFCFKVKNVLGSRYLLLFSWTQSWNKLLHICEVQMGLLASKGSWNASLEANKLYLFYILLFHTGIEWKISGTKVL